MASYFPLSVVIPGIVVMLWEEDGLDMRKALSRDVEKKSIIPLKRPVTPDELENGILIRVVLNLGKHKGLLGNWLLLNSSSVSLQNVDDGELKCNELKMDHVSVLVKAWTWIPDNLDNLYSCRCGLSCLWTKSSVLGDKPDALLFETATPPIERHQGDPLRVYMDLEAGRKKSGYEDIFISYHAEDDVQNQLAKRILSLLPSHSFGKCLNNVGGLDKALSLYPKCVKDSSEAPTIGIICIAMSHYKFVLAIENTRTESYVTEKLFYALDSGAVPIYFGAPNVWDFVPPNSVIDGSKFSSLEELASYVKAVANDPVAYAEYHAWRRCGALGNYRKPGS
ncbi:4-alpha-L-fucosyltransferase [Datura stramonium]|uniref:Fucosyltransferase n=1 Tax=Datura stramonium TaxID=4076 RepID=A0ABS8WT54_DATST|nr:4-alpha-L-fucosyltransferase [Datura stramonium]